MVKQADDSAQSTDSEAVKRQQLEEMSSKFEKMFKAGSLLPPISMMIRKISSQLVQTTLSHLESPKHST